MKFTALFTAVALAATTASAAAVTGNKVSSDLMVALDYQNAVTCGQKNPYANMLIDAFCSHEGLAVQTPFARNGLIHDGYKIKVTGPTCPANSRFIPANYCHAQFHYLCANIGGPKGAGHMRFGAGGCQQWSITKISTVHS